MIAPFQLSSGGKVGFLQPTAAPIFEWQETFGQWTDTTIATPPSNPLVTLPINAALVWRRFYFALLVDGFGSPFFLGELLFLKASAVLAKIPINYAAFGYDLTAGSLFNNKGFQFPFSARHYSSWGGGGNPGLIGEVTSGANSRRLIVKDNPEGATSGNWVFDISPTELCIEADTIVVNMTKFNGTLDTSASNGVIHIAMGCYSQSLPL